MDEENYCNKQTFASIVKTILLFLENNNLRETSRVFNEEIEKKMPDIKMSEVPPRTVILRPMDITTNVDATISDENLIICISGKNTDGSSTDFNKKTDQINIRSNENHLSEITNDTLLTNFCDELCSTPPPLNFQEGCKDKASSENSLSFANENNPSTIADVTKCPSTTSKDSTITVIATEKDNQRVLTTSSLLKSNESHIGMLSKNESDAYVETDPIATTDSVVQSQEDFDEYRKESRTETCPCKPRQRTPVTLPKRFQAKSASPTRVLQNPSATKYQSPSVLSKNDKVNSPKRAKTASCNSLKRMQFVGKECENCEDNQSISSAKQRLDRDFRSMTSKQTLHKQSDQEANLLKSKGIAGVERNSSKLRQNEDKGRILDGEMDSTKNPGGNVEIFKHESSADSLESNNTQIYDETQTNSSDDEMLKFKSYMNGGEETLDSKSKETSRSKMISCCEEIFKSKMIRAREETLKSNGCREEISKSNGYQEEISKSKLNGNEEEILKDRGKHVSLNEDSKYADDNNQEKSVINSERKSKSLETTLTYSNNHIIEEESVDDDCSCVESGNSEIPPQEPPVVSSFTSSQKKASSSLSSLVPRAHPFCQLNYKKIKLDLQNGTCEVKLKILQALRWRLTRSDAKVRDHNLVCFITHDLLNIGEGSEFFEQYFKEAKDCNSMALQEEASRFINTLASMSMGREYLEKCPNLIEILLPVLTNVDEKEKINFENLNRQYVMATIQKLSLGGKIRKSLINEGVVEWLIKYMLTYHEQMTDYEAEYSVALFSNLCIHRTMRELCEIASEDTARLLNVLVYTPHKCCLPYLSGILGSLLTSPSINNRAAEMNIQKKLKYLAECAGDDETRHQLEFIIQLHESSPKTNCMYDVIEEPQIYSDYLECELGMNDPSYSNPVGERFLEGYCSTFPNLEKHVHVVKRSCSYGVNYNHPTNDYRETDRINTTAGNYKNEVLINQHPAAAKRPVTKADIFKDLFDQVLFSSTFGPSPLTSTSSCRLTYQNLRNSPVSIPVRYSPSNISKNKYSCACYDEIKNVYLGKEEMVENSSGRRSVQNSGRKANNVV